MFVLGFLCGKYTRRLRKAARKSTELAKRAVVSAADAAVKVAKRVAGGRVKGADGAKEEAEEEAEAEAEAEEPELTLLEQYLSKTNVPGLDDHPELIINPVVKYRMKASPPHDLHTCSACTASAHCTCVRSSHRWPVCTMSAPPPRRRRTASGWRAH